MDMMQITAIEWLTKTKAKVYLDEEAAFILTASDLAAYGLEEGSWISQDTYDELFNDVLLKRVKLKALSLLQSKDYSEYELHSKLKRDFISTALADSAVDYIKSYHYIDDRRYAENFVRYRSNGLSRLMIRQKLRSKGIDDAIINEALEAYEVDDMAQIRTIITRKFGEISQIPKDKHQKIMNFLLRKGYYYHDVQSVIKDFDTNE